MKLMTQDKDFLSISSNNIEMLLQNLVWLSESENIKFTDLQII